MRDKGNMFVRFLVVVALMLVAVAAGYGLGQNTKQSSDPADSVSESDFTSRLRETLQAHPEFVIEALRAMEAQNAQADRQPSAQNIQDAADLLDMAKLPIRVIGDGRNPVTIYEFLDYQCVWCRRMHETLTDSSESLHIVVVDFPILGAVSERAARLSLAVSQSAPEHYETFHHDLMSLPLSLEVLDALLLEHGLDTEQINAIADSAETSATIAHNHEIAQSLGIQGTPAMIIGSHLQRGALQPESLAELIAQARAQ